MGGRLRVEATTPWRDAYRKWPWRRLRHPSAALTTSQRALVEGCLEGSSSLAASLHASGIWLIFRRQTDWRRLRRFCHVEYVIYSRPVFRVDDILGNTECTSRLLRLTHDRVVRNVFGPPM